MCFIQGEGIEVEVQDGINGSPGRARSDVPCGPVNDDLPESLTADPVTLDLMIARRCASASDDES